MKLSNQQDRIYTSIIFSISGNVGIPLSPIACPPVSQGASSSHSLQWLMGDCTKAVYKGDEGFFYPPALACKKWLSAWDVL